MSADIVRQKSDMQEFSDMKGNVMLECMIKNHEKQILSEMNLLRTKLCTEPKQPLFLCTKERLNQSNSGM